MSDLFKGITFPWQEVTPSDDAIIRKAVLPDRRLSGCELSYSGYTLTMTAGVMIVCGRQFRHTAAQNWAITGATSGYARLLLTIDTTKASTEDAFEQITASIEYATAADGFPNLRQDDINNAGTVYQTSICVVALGPGGITRIVNQIIPGDDVFYPGRPVSMGGHQVKDVAAPEEDGDAVNLGYANEHFAPAVESADYPGCYYRTVDGEVEWLNPPLLFDTEYRTTERWRGNRPVYQQLISFGAMPNAARATVSVTGVNAEYVTEIRGVTSEGRTIPYGSTNTTWGSVDLFANVTGAGNITVIIETTSDQSDNTAYILMKYVKPKE